MWHLIFLLIGSAVAGESGPESSLQEFSDTTIKIEAPAPPLPYEEAFPTPLPGLLYPRESESREVKDLSDVTTRWSFKMSLEPGSEITGSYFHTFIKLKNVLNRVFRKAIRDIYISLRKNNSKSSSFQ